MQPQCMDYKTHTTSWSALNCSIALLLFLCQVPVFAATEQPAKNIYVGVSRHAGDGLSADRPLTSINAAFKKARKGDTIIVAPGEYRESILVSVSGVTVQGCVSEDNIPMVTILTPLEKSVSLLIDSTNTLWRGVGFQLTSRAAVALRGFTGRFERCLFASESPVPAIEVDGGTPVFHGCTFQGGTGPDALLAFNGQAGQKSNATIAYCLFRDISGAAVLLRGEQDVRFVNCLFAACRYVTMRHKDVKAQISATNCIFFLSSESKLFLQANSSPKVQLTNCLYSPGPGNYMKWQVKPLEQQQEVTTTNCITASPRFEGGRHALINLCVDDTVNAPVWRSLTPAATKLGLQITLALNADALSPQYWRMIIPEVNAGFEVASHGAVHASITSAEVIRVGWFAQQGDSANLSIDQAQRLRVVVDGKELCTIDLAAEPYLSMGGLVRLLREKNLRAELVSLSHEKIPAYLLAPISEQDIFFERHNPELVMDTTSFMHYMMSESRRKIEQGLREKDALQKACIAFVCPYSETNANIRQAMKGTGIVIARSHMQQHFPSATESVDLSALQSISLKDLLIGTPTTNIKEMLRLYIDYLKYHGSIMGLYSHGINEWTTSQWLELFEVLNENPEVKTAGLAEIASIVKELCEPTGPWTYRCPSATGPVSGKTSFRARKDSPLLGAGLPTEFNTDFSGTPLPVGRAPNIGLY